MTDCTEALRLLRYLWEEADVQARRVDGGKVRDAFDGHDPLATEIEAALSVPAPQLEQTLASALDALDRAVLLIASAEQERAEALELLHDAQPLGMKITPVDWQRRRNALDRTKEPRP